MNQPDPRRDAAALAKRNRVLMMILAAIAALMYFGIQARWSGH